MRRFFTERGAAFGDVNNDGNIDVLLLNVGEPPSLLLNHGVEAAESGA